jgi:hypothetical protein
LSSRSIRARDVRSCRGLVCGFDPACGRGQVAVWTAEPTQARRRRSPRLRRGVRSTGTYLSCTTRIPAASTKLAGTHHEVLPAKLDRALTELRELGPCRTTIGVGSLPHESGWVRQSPVSRRTGRVHRPPSRSIQVAVAGPCLAVRAWPRGGLRAAPIRCRLRGHLKCLCLPGICARSAYRRSQRAQRPPPVTRRFAQETPCPANRAPGRVHVLGKRT